MKILNKGKYRITGIIEKKKIKQILKNGFLILSMLVAHIQTGACSDYINDSIAYREILDSLNKDDFDEEFINIYNNAIYNFKNKTYKIDEIHIIQSEDKTIHIIETNNQNTDLITGEIITEKRLHMCTLRDSSIFYTLYKNNLIENNIVNLNDKIIQEYLNTWNGFIHTNTPENEAKKLQKEQKK